MLYFAYGSNINRKRLSERINSFDSFSNLVQLNGFELKFNKISKDNSAKATIFKNENSSVLGSIYSINDKNIKLLDKFEGYKHGYDKIFFDLTDFFEIRNDDYISFNAIKPAKVMTYIATNVSDDFLPYDWYLHLIIDGMISNNYPKYYIEKMLTIKTKEDIDKKRKFSKLSLLENFEISLNLKKDF